jgi:glycosyltransferase involved in cell wall biosynthesis
MRRVGANSDRPTVALLPWGDLFEDWLDPLGVGIDAFRDEFVGSWMFGWAEALATADVRTAIIAVTTRVQEPLAFEHGPTGAPVHLLPATPPYRQVARRMLRESLGGRRDLRSVGGAVLAHAAPYLATPPRLLARALRHERCRALVCQEYETPRFDVSTVLGRTLRIPVFATFQGGDYRASRLERLIRPLGMRLATGFVVPTRAEAERVRRSYRVPERLLARIFNPVDASFWRAEERSFARAALGLPANARIVVWHGQLHPRKGIDLLLAAWRATRGARAGHDLELVLVGAGELDLAGGLEQDGVRLVREWVLDRARIRRYLSAADVYAFPSRREGFPVAPLEAMSCGLPVVATAAQGVRDIFAAGERDGGIVLEVDDTEGFAAGLGRLLDDTTTSAELGRRARERIEAAFAPEPVGRALRAFLVDRTTIGAGADALRNPPIDDAGD